MEKTMRINSHYELVYDGRRIVLRSPNKEVDLLRIPSEKTLYLCYPHHPATTEDAEELVRRGEAIRTTPYRLVTQLMGEDFACEHYYGCSLRTRNYLQAVKRNRGLKDFRSGWDLKVPENSRLICEKAGYSLYRTEGEYIVEKYEVYPPDDYAIVHLVFSRKPSMKDVVVVETAVEVETAFMLRTIRETFACWECGRKVHWLDIEADDFLQRVDRLMEGYCGC